MNSETTSSPSPLLPFPSLPFLSFKHVPHLYTSPTSPDAARCWIPCVDNLWERCTWELDFVVARRLIDYQDPQEEAGRRRRKGKGKEKARAIEANPEMGMPIVVACSGELVEHVSRVDLAL